MKSNRFRNVFVFRKFIGLCLFTILLASGVLASSIEGFVFDQNRNALDDVDIELLNENRQLRQRARSDSVGRYAFNGLADGRYYVRVLPFRFNLQKQEIMVRIDTVRILGGIGGDVIQRDFFLKPLKGRLSDTTTGVVFAQSVPKEAEDYFDSGTRLLAQDKRSDGIKELIKAVNSFPEYYAAWKRLGAAFLANKQPLQAARSFMQAASANPKSSNAFYYMGISFSRAGKDYYKAALASQIKAQRLAGNAPEVRLEIGKLHRKLGNPAEAELHLVKAKNLATESNRVLAHIHKELTELYSNDLKQYAKAARELESYMKVTNQRKNKDLQAQLTKLKAKA